MAKRQERRNNSSQMTAILQADNKSDDRAEENKEREGKRGAADDTDQASSSSSAFSFFPLGSSCDEVKRSREEKGNKHMDEAASSCCKLEDLKRLPECQHRLGPLTYSSSHAVLVDVKVFKKGQLVPQEGRDMWHSNFVRMPCSPSNGIPNKSVFSKPRCRWDEISKVLGALAKQKSATVDHVAEAIIKYNPRYKGQWSFEALSTFVKRVPAAENYFPALFPKIAALALKLPQYVKKAIPLLQRGQSASITLSQVQISCLLANAFYCTFPHRNTSSPDAEYHNYPTINFNSLFEDWTERKREKLRAIMHYFKTVTDQGKTLSGLVTFEKVCHKQTSASTWRSCTQTMPKLYVASQGTIESEGTGMLQVDFACNLIGGGVLSSGLVQEEILFLMNPELIVSRLFTEKLGDDECLIIKGSQQFSCYSGFSDSFEWAGPCEDHLKVTRDEWLRLQRHILAMDALRFRHRGEQFNMQRVMRELNKAYCGFRAQTPHETDIATGKWGCGAFNGDPQLKAVIQLMAAAMARRGMAFFTFGDNELKERLQETHHLLVTQGITVGTLFELLEDYCAVQQCKGTPQELFKFIRNTVGCKSLL